MEKTARKPYRGLRIFLIVLLVICVVFLIAVIALNVYVRTTYADFYAKAQKEFAIPGISAGFVEQDIDYLEGEDIWLFSGYLAQGGASPVYKRFPDGSDERFFVDLPDGSAYDGHGAGITSNEEYAYLTTDTGYLVLQLADVVSAASESHVQALAEVPIEFMPAFINIEEDVLFIGNFYSAGTYETPSSHRITTPANDNHTAMIYAYPLDEAAPYGYAEEAAWAYSIREKCQGVCLTPEGNIVLSTSAGISTSHLLVYDPSQATVGDFEADGNTVPLYFLDSDCLVYDQAAPPMAEGIESLDGRLYFGEEAASNKYIYGKFYGAGDVYSIAL